MKLIKISISILIPAITAFILLGLERSNEEINKFLQRAEYIENTTRDADSFTEKAKLLTDVKGMSLCFIFAECNS